MKLNDFRHENIVISLLPIYVISIEFFTCSINPICGIIGKQHLYTDCMNATPSIYSSPDCFTTSA